MRLPWWNAIFPPVSRRLVIACAIGLAVAVVGGGTVALGYDRSTLDEVLPGTTIGGVAVGGMRVQDALDELRGELEDPLHLPIRVRAPNVERMATPWDLGLRVDVDGAMRAALREGRDGNLLRRVWRRMTGAGRRSFDLRPALDRDRLVSFVREAADRVFVPSADATLEVSGGWVRVHPGHPGRELDLAAAERDLLRAIRTGTEEIKLTAREVQPRVPASAFAKVVLVRTGENRLYLYENGVVTRTYAVATGAAEFPTPTGTFKVVSKRVNPKWVNPGSEWARRLPSYIPPGPDNPLGSRAMDLNTSGIRIHGTPDAGSIGYSVSHGCVRMTMADAEELFARVSTGTPVVIVGAGPPRPRPKPSPPSPVPPAAPAAPAQG